MPATVLASSSVRAGVSVSAARPAAVTPVPAPLQKAKLIAASAVLSAGLSAGAADASVELKFPGPLYDSSFPVEMLVEGMEVKPAAEGVIPGTGHHHLVIDGPAPKEGEAIPFDASHMHFGKGQTTATLTLPAGKHSIIIAFANAKHESYGPDYTKEYDVEVLPAPSEN